MIGSLEYGSIYHTVSWSSHRSKIPVRSIVAGEVLAAGATIDDGVVLKRVYGMPLYIDFELIVALDSRDSFSSLATQWQSIYRSIRSDVNFIRYELDIKHANRISWIPGRLILSDQSTNQDSPFVPPLQLLLFSGKLTHPFPGMKAACAA